MPAVEAAAERSVRARRDRRIALVIASGASVAAATLLVALLPYLTRGDTLPVASPALLARGAAVYATACAGCHGADLKGQSATPAGIRRAPPLDASGHGWLHSDGELTRIVEGGLTECPSGSATAMPGFAGRLSTQSIRAALAFVKSRWPAELREIQNALTEANTEGTASPRALCSPLCRPLSPVGSADLTAESASPTPSRSVAR